MKILHLAKYQPEKYSGGMETCVRLMRDVAIKAGYEVDVMGIDPTASEPSSYYLRPGIKVGPIHISLDYLKTIKKLYEYDLIHIHTPNPMFAFVARFYLSFLKYRSSQKLVPVFHAPILNYTLLGQVYQNWENQFLAKSCYCFVLHSHEMMDIFSELKDYQSKKTVLPWPTQGVKKIKLRKVSQETYFDILSIGRLVPYKGFDVLIQAVNHIKDPSLRLFLIGKGPQKKYLEKLKSESAYPENIVFLNAVEESEKITALNQCDLFVLPSRTAAEAYGIVIAEAFSCQKAVITTQLNTGVSFLARKGECGAVVPPNDVLALASEIQALRSDELRRKKAEKSNFEFWKKNLSPEKFEEKYTGFLEELFQSTDKAAKKAS